MSAEELKTFREKIAKLSPEKQKQVENLVDFLLDQVKKSQKADKSKKTNKAL
jgi:mRNA-degrading endonuclease RelE of RelBE toxin-antitoxin system